jgi:predicted acylesterase/phospholipase RssA
MNKPQRIQLALQGGGAKLCALLAAIEEIQALEKEGRLHVTRVAGASAGAIAACIFAAGIEMPVVRARIDGIPSREIRKIFPEPTLLSWRLFARLVRGRPMWKIDKLRTFLDSFFKSSGLHTLADLKARKGIEVLIVAANLTDGRKEVYREGNIVSAVLNSAGIPYFLRTWNKSGTPVIVDGGLCENLPYEELVTQIAEYGPVVGISFSPKCRREVTNIVQFTRALLDTAIESSMELARRRIGEASVFTIQTDLDTFDFYRARREGFRDSYALVRTRARQFFEDFIRRQSRTKSFRSGDPWKILNMDLAQRLNDVYQRHAAVAKYSYLRCSVIAQARCLLEEGEPEYGRPDGVHYEAEVQTLEHPVYCHKIIVSNAKHARLEHTQWSVVNIATGESIETIDLPVATDEVGRERQLLLFFSPILPNHSGPYLIDFQDLADGFLQGLRSRGTDEFGFQPIRSDGTVGQIDLVLWIPKRFAKARMTSRAGVGRPMLPKELIGKYAPPPDFRALGWTAQNVPGTDLFLVDVHV